MILKKGFLLLSLFIINFFTINAQTTEDYKANWKKVAEFEIKGLPKSALKEVILIFNLATKAGNDAQQIKAALHHIMFRIMVEEDNEETNLFYLDTLIAKAKAPAKNILLSLQAEKFWNYLQNNRWKFYDRTNLVEQKSNDISTWSIEKLYEVIARLNKLSLQNETLLKNTKLDGFDAIIIKGQNSRHLRPTLYDFIAHRALNFFTDDIEEVIKPAYSFTITDPLAFAPITDFVNAKFITKDTASGKLKALLLMQDIARFHLNDVNVDALLDVDLARLAYLQINAVMENKDKLYETALLNIENRFNNHPAAAQAMYLRGVIYLTRGRDFDPITKTDHQYEIKRAKAIFELAYTRFPKSEGGINSKNSIIQIEFPSLSLHSEKVNVPGQPFRTLVNYKNVKTLYLRLIKTSKKEMKKINNTNYNKYWDAITKLNPVKSWSLALPNLQDFQSHSTEIKIDALPIGSYLILASIDENFATSNNIIAKQQCLVSNISYINNAGEYYVLNRDNGLPLANTQIQIWETKYNANYSQQDEIKAEHYIADKNGYFKTTPTKEYRNYKMQFIYGDDELFPDEYNYQYNYNSYEPAYEPQTFLFTDRSIYRPGQTIFFKGIVIKKEIDAGKTSVLPNFKTTVELYDANHQLVSEIDVTSNEFGSYKGSFRLPQGTLNGSFSIEDLETDGSQSFQVEEYKRPKFYSEIQKPKGTYRVNDSIEVTGLAKAYAGNFIDGAKVSYRVVRKVKYPIWWGYYRPGIYGRTQEMEITNGETKTDSKGEFKINFKAIPDETVIKKDQPTFYYEVTADITDINGETRSGNTTVAVAYQMLQLNIETPSRMIADSFKNLAISSTNLNDIFEKSFVNVRIHKLDAPTKLFRTRFWKMPDQFTMSKDEYYTNFPYDLYKDEDIMAAWELKDKLVDRSDSTSENATFNIQNTKFEPGWYKIIATAKDKYGEEVKTEKFIQLFNMVNNEVITEPIKIDVTKGKVEPGESIRYQIKTGFDKIWLIHTLNKMNNSSNINYYSLDNSAKSFETIVAESDRGGMALNYLFVKNNRLYTGNENFNIPWSNKELQITYETFRDKLLPGAEEKWKIKIAGPKGEKTAAEMLAGMYDASLDQFRPHQWQALDIWPSISNTTNWNSNNFTQIQSQQYQNKQSTYLTAEPKTYDQLNNFENYRYQNFGNKKMMKLESAPMLDSSLNEVVVTGYGLQGKVAGAQERSQSKAKLGAATMVRLRGENGLIAGSAAIYVVDGTIVSSDADIDPDDIKDITVLQGPAASALYGPQGANGAIIITTKSGKGVIAKNPVSEVKIRKNFNETAFFFPDLKTDSIGNVEFSFTMPEALTKWKLMTLAHNKELASAYGEKTLVTQKTLMVQPNAPRFMREGDNMEFSAKIVNLSDKELTGTAQLELLDAATNKPVDGWFKNVFPNQYFTVAAGQSEAVMFPMEIPFNFNSALSYRIVARAGDFSDGEEMAFPILTNRMLVTESLPLNLRKETSKSFKFDKLLNSGNSTTLTHHALTVEYTSNPAWYAVQALPYLMEYPYECAEQTFNKYYANTLASFISNSHPKIKTVFEKWKNLDTTALMSNLQKNEELKSALLQETPWVLNAQNENQQKKNIALLFDMERMSKEQDIAFTKLVEMQTPNGGFTWFKGGGEDRYMTQYIITGIGHLRKLNALKGDSYEKIKPLVDKAIIYLDKKIKEDYQYLIKQKVKLKNNNLDYIAVQYLYMRSFYPEYKINAGSQIAYNYYRGQSKQFWLSNSKYMQAMIALSLHRTKDELTPKAIIKSLKENAIVKEEMGMYWKEWTTGGYYWHQAPIESQAMMIEAFMDIDKNKSTVDDLKTWLLKQKQTQNWKTTKATAEACYALLISPSPPTPQGGIKTGSWLDEETEVIISLGDYKINSNGITSTKNPPLGGRGAQAGTGYFKTKVEGDLVKADMGNISLSINSSNSKNPPLGGGGVSWGSVYWQYFEDLDKITSAETPLKLKKKLFIEINTDKGPVLMALEDGAQLKVGDKVKVRIELKVDRDMEYVHMKDMRAACMEPVNVISQYKYQGGLGYYESTKDASTNFFFGWLSRGSYVFEYPMFVTHTGNFSNGITTIQCMYAPEFTSHSEGIRVNVE